MKLVGNEKYDMVVARGIRGTMNIRWNGHLAKFKILSQLFDGITVYVMS